VDSVGSGCIVIRAFEGRTTFEASRTVSSFDGADWCCYSLSKKRLLPYVMDSSQARGRLKAAWSRQPSSPLVA
jgi:hypothetical protein